MACPNDEWQRKGATLSDKTARREFGLTQDEIYDAIDAGALQYRQAYMHGNPWLRLLRREVEALARARHGDRYVSEQQARAELTRVNRCRRQTRRSTTYAPFWSPQLWPTACAARRCRQRLSFFSRRLRLAFPTAWTSLPPAQENRIACKARRTQAPPG